MSEVPALELVGLSKTFGKERKALDGVDLLVREGSIFGFLGPNGAGKTTALRILAGLAHPTAGKAMIFGKDVATADSSARALIGFLPDVPGFYPWMTAREFLRFAGDIFGLAGSILDERVEVLLDLASLSDEDGRVGGFSRGMRQRLGVAQALINAPRLLLLDEPTSALDPIGRKELLDMVTSLRGRTTVFFSTHILSDVERVCDSVAILDRGRLVVKASIGELKARFGGHKIILELATGDGTEPDRSNESSFVSALREEPWVTAIDKASNGDALICMVTDLGSAQRRIPAVVADFGLGIRRMEVDEPSLEEVFVQLVGRATD